MKHTNLLIIFGIRKECNEYIVMPTYKLGDKAVVITE
jgi:hypothetical protein